jgi:hypothetical protein
MLALLTGGACAGPSLSARPADAQAIERLFPIIEELGVDVYGVDDRCRFLYYRRGSFSNDTGPGAGCSVYDMPDPVAFDAQANADMERLMAAVRNNDTPVDYFSIEHGNGRWIGPRSFFSIGPCDSLVYDPGYKALPSLEPLPEGDEEIVRAVTPDWYEDALSC